MSSGLFVLSSDDLRDIVLRGSVLCGGMICEDAIIQPQQELASSSLPQAAVKGPCCVSPLGSFDATPKGRG